MILYRTTGAWGAGAGANLTAAQVDGNFYDLSTRVQYLEINPAEPVQIESFSATGDQFYVHMSNGDVQGPLTLPVIRWNFRGPWTPSTYYLKDDVVVGPDNQVYLVIFTHTSPSGTFDPGANDGAGHDYYSILLIAPASVLPADGDTGMVLTKSTDLDYAVTWTNAALPLGGDAGDVLTKLSSESYDRGWLPPSSSNSVVLTSATWAPTVGQENTFAVITNGSSNITIIIPANIDEAFPIGTELHIHQDGTGSITIQGNTGVTLRWHANFLNMLLGQYATATVKKTAADVWRLFGLLVRV